MECGDRIAGSAMTAIRPWTRNIPTCTPSGRRRSSQPCLPPSSCPSLATRHCPARGEWRRLHPDSTGHLPDRRSDPHPRSQRAKPALRRAPPSDGLVHITNLAKSVQLFAGDLLIPADQPAARYLIETLSPQAVGLLSVGTSSTASSNRRSTSLPTSSRTRHRTWCFSTNPQPCARHPIQRGRNATCRRGAQLDFIYRRSPHSEGTAGRYPIFRIPAGQSLPFVSDLLHQFISGYHQAVRTLRREVLDATPGQWRLAADTVARLYIAAPRPHRRAP